jgi:hypothetical protein
VIRRPPDAPSSSRSGGEGNYGWFIGQVDRVVDPVAQRCAGWPDVMIRPILSRSWREAFGADLDERALAECAAAIHHERRWVPVLWSGGW